MTRRHSTIRQLFLSLYIVGASLLMMSSCLTYGSSMPFAYENNFTEIEVEERLLQLGEIGGFDPAIGSLDGYRNGFVSIMDIDRPETQNGNRADWRELMMFQETSPVLYDRIGEGIRYHIPLVDAVTYRATANEYSTPERTHLGIIHVVVGAVSGHDVRNYREGVDMDSAGMTQTIADVRSFDDQTGQLVYGPPRAQTLYHPGLSRFPRTPDDFFEEPSDTLDTLTSLFERYGPSSVETDVEITGLSEVDLIPIRQETRNIERQGYNVSQQTIYEAYAVGEHNVYIGLVLDGSGVLYIDGTGVAGNSGTVGLAFLVFDSEVSLLAALEGSKDWDGFDLVTGRNDAGFYPDGSADDGRFFAGTVDAEGRQGQGTTFFPDGRLLSGNYINDRLHGYAYEQLTDGTMIYGFRRDGALDGEFLVVAPEAEPVVVRFANGEEMDRSGYEDPFGESGWIWVGGLSGDGSVDAISLDGRSYLSLVSDGTYRIRTGSTTYTGPMPTKSSVEARIDYIDGRTYVGTVASGAPEGEGTMTFSDGTELAGNFENGRPDGEMVLVEGDSVTTVRYFEGRPVGVERSPQQQSPSLSAFIEESSEGYLEYVAAVRQQRAAQRAEFFSDIASVAFNVLDTTVTAMESYNAQVAAQEPTPSAYSSYPSGALENDAVARANPPYWSSAGGKPSVPSGSVQLATIVEAADRYYDQYTQAVSSGDQGRAGQLWQGHVASVQNAIRLSRSLEQSGNGRFTGDAGESDRSSGRSTRPSGQSGGTNPCVDYDGPGECAQEQ